MTTTYHTPTFRTVNGRTMIAVLCDRCRGAIWQDLDENSKLDRPAVPEHCVDCAEVMHIEARAEAKG